MSNSDGFIEEVTEELRRERLFATMKKYGWIAALAVILIVGGAAWNEYRKAQAEAQAQDLGDAILTALEQPEAAERASALAGLEAGTPEAQAVVDLLEAAQLVDAGDTDAALAHFDAVATTQGVPQVYGQIAQFKAATLQADSLPAADRRQRFEVLAQPGSPMRLLAEEQLALIDIQESDTDAAIARYQSILTDAEVTADLQERAVQVIVALGGDPELGGAPNLAPETGGN